MSTIARRALGAARASLRAFAPRLDPPDAIPSCWAPWTRTPPTSTLRLLPPTREYFAGHPQIRNADGQDMAQIRAGVRLRKALCAVMTHPSMHHRFEDTGVTILEVRMARDFKLAHVRWTVADGGDRREAARALRANATKLRSLAARMLRSKHTPRLEFVDDERRSAAELELDRAFARAERRERETARRVAELAEEEAAVDAAKAAGTYVPGKYEALRAEGEEAAAARAAAAAADDRRLGYAFEEYDGGAYRSDFVYDDDDLDDADLHDYAESEDHGESQPRVVGSNPDADDDAAEAWRRKVRDAADALRAAEAEFAALDASDDGDDADVYGADDDMDFDALVDDIVEEMEAEDAAASADWNASDPRDGISRAAAAAREADDDFDSDGDFVEGDEFDDEDDDEVDDFDFDKFDEGERAREERSRRRR